MTDAINEQRARRAERRAESQATTASPGNQSRSPTEQWLCVHRSDDSIGKVRCSCATAPEVYGCDQPAIVSHFCTPVLPQRPGDGPIVFHDGRTTADRYLPYPLEPDDKPRRRDVICCSSCPHREEPGPERLAALQLGVLGTDLQGRCEVLHLIDRSYWPQRDKHTAAVSLHMTVARCQLTTPETWIRAIELTQPRLLVLHAPSIQAAWLDVLAERFPNLPYLCVCHGKQRLALRPCSVDEWCAIHHKDLALSAGEKRDG